MKSFEELLREYHHWVFQNGGSSDGVKYIDNQIRAKNALVDEYNRVLAISQQPERQRIDTNLMDCNNKMDELIRLLKNINNYVETIKLNIY